MASTHFKSFSADENHHIRSTSLPTRPHKVILEAQDEIRKFRKWESSISSVPTADTICIALTKLQVLYECVDSVLSLPLTQQALTHNKCTELVNELLDKSINLMDICGSTRDLVSQVKENARVVQSAMRRRKGEVSLTTSFIKNLRKDCNKAMTSLKQIDEKIGGIKPIDMDLNLLSAIKVVRDVGVVRSSVYKSLLLFLSGSVAKPKASKWSLLNKLMTKESDDRNKQIEISSEDMVCLFQEMENGLECMFRSLIKTRTCLLNVLSR